MSPIKALVVALTIAMSLLPTMAAFADTEVTVANTSEDSETTTGDSTSTNDGSSQTGHQGGGSSQVGAQDIESDQATNVQEGDNEVDASQQATSSSGDAVGGQVIGAVTDGDLTVDATNRSEDVSATTGDATSDNDFDAFIGLSNASETAIGTAEDIDSDFATNLQEGDNAANVTQRSDAVTGDAVAGQVFGATASGTTDVVLANTSVDTDATSGDSDQTDDSDVFTGLAASGVIDV